MKVKSLGGILILLFLAACGPIIGSAMVSSNGVKDFKVTEGQLSDLKAGSQVLIVAPFATTPESFYICRGEDASVFVDAINETGLFNADFHMENRFEDNSGLIAGLKKESPSTVQSKLHLKDAPQIIMTGTVLKRQTVAAPAKGVIMEVSYRLEFYNLTSAKKTVIEIDVKDMFQDCIRTAVKELTKRVAG